VVVKSLLCWAIAVGALAGAGQALFVHDPGTAKPMLAVAAVFGALGHLAKWKATR
jgi:hypothetical protein